MGPLDDSRIERFIANTTFGGPGDKPSRWAWCGLYSVPMGLLTAFHLQRQLGAPHLDGHVLDYSTSIDHPSLPVSDLSGMGVTAPAHPRHWVGYTSVGFR